MSKRQDHPEHSALLRALDGEVSPEEARRISEHLQGCWHCRARSAIMQTTIVDLVSFFKTEQPRAVPPPPRGWSDFAGRLNWAIEEPQEESLPRRVARVLAGLPARRPAARVALAASAAALAIVFLLRFYPVQKVTADEVLQRAAAAEATVFRSPRALAVYQKLSFRFQQETRTRITYRDVMHRRVVTEWEGESFGKGHIDSLMNAFRLSRLEWDNPLSAAGFRRVVSEGEGAGEVSIEAAGGTVRLRQVRSTGPVREAELVVRQADYHPVAQRLKMAEDVELEVKELAYQELPLESLNPAIFNPPEPLPVAVPVRLATPPPPAPAGASAEELEAEELQARAILHAAGADLGEGIEVKRSPESRIVVSGMVATEARKQELKTALSQLPLVNPELFTFQEAESLAGAQPSQSLALAAAEAGAPLMRETLKQSMPNMAERQEFVRMVLDLSQDALTHALAVKALAERYPEGTAAQIPPASREQLVRMLRDHAARLRQDEDLLLTHAGAVLGAPAALAAPAENSQTGWQGAFQEILPDLQRQHELLLLLFAEGPAEGGDPAAARGEAAARIARVLARASIVLDNLPSDNALPE